MASRVWATLSGMWRCIDNAEADKLSCPDIAEA